MKKPSFGMGTVVVFALIGFVLGVGSGKIWSGAPPKCNTAPKFGSCPIIVWEEEVGKPCDKEIAVATFAKDAKQQAIFYAICPQHHGSIWPVKIEPGPPTIVPKR